MEIGIAYIGEGAKEYNKQTVEVVEISDKR